MSATTLFISSDLYMVQTRELYYGEISHERKNL